MAFFGGEVSNWLDLRRKTVLEGTGRRPNPDVRQQLASKEKTSEQVGKRPEAEYVELEHLLKTPSPIKSSPLPALRPIRKWIPV